LQRTEWERDARNKEIYLNLYSHQLLLNLMFFYLCIVS